MGHYDVIVMGIGGMGSATAYNLARRGLKVLGLEKYNIVHEMGSSHGVNRIIRLAYCEHPSYVPLLFRAYELWREMENLGGERILFITGGIDAGPENGLVVKGSIGACKQYSLQHEVYDSRQLTRRFPGYSLSQDMLAVYQPDAGFVLSERAIMLYAAMAMDRGAEIHAREAVTGWEVRGKTVEVRTASATYSANRLVIAGGAWAGKSLPFLKGLAAPERQVLLWTRPLRPERFRLGTFPVFNLEAPEGRFYGLPIYEFPGFKIGKYHHRGEQIDPDRMDRECYPEDEQLLREAITHYFPDGNGPTLALKTCIFTNTPDEHFILDLHPDFPQVVIAAGFSGHGFKFCSVVGEIMADLAADGQTSHDISLFRLNRFLS